MMLWSFLYVAAGTVTAGLCHPHIKKVSTAVVVILTWPFLWLYGIGAALSGDDK